MTDKEFEKEIETLDTGEEVVYSAGKDRFQKKTVSQKLKAKLPKRYTFIVALLISCLLCSCVFYHIGRQLSFSRGYDDGYDEGFDVGYNDGIELSLKENDFSGEADGSEEEAVSAAGTEAVYCTESGESYHYAGCSYIEGKDNLKEMTVQEAESAGLDPCSKCVQ